MVWFLCWFPTIWCQLRSRSQEPGPETLELTLETRYPHNMGSHATTLENIYDEQANCMNPTVVEWRMSMMMMMMMSKLYQVTIFQNSSLTVIIETRKSQTQEDNEQRVSNESSLVEWRACLYNWKLFNVVKEKQNVQEQQGNNKGKHFV